MCDYKSYFSVVHFKRLLSVGCCLLRLRPDTAAGLAARKCAACDTAAGSTYLKGWSW